MLLKPPTEVLLQLPSPDPDLQRDYEELARQFRAIVRPVPVRIVHGDGSDDPEPWRGAALYTPGGVEALKLLESMIERGRGQGDGWRWVHLSTPDPRPAEGWPALPGDPLLTYARGSRARSVAEWGMASLLYFARNLDRHGRDARAHRWKPLEALSLVDLRVTVLGAGMAGSEFAFLARPFDLDVFGVARRGALAEGFRELYPPSELHNLLPTSDVVFVLLPNTDETRGSFGEMEISLMPPGSILLVASAGGVVDEGAVLRAVRSGHLRGAAFDVFADEPLSRGSSLWEEPGILLTPHVAGASDDRIFPALSAFETVWECAFTLGLPDDLAEYAIRGLPDRLADTAGRS